MYLLTTDEALLLVSKNFDEVMANESDMIVDDLDSENFADVLSKTLPEAINEVHAKSPVEILDGLTLTPDELDSVGTLPDGFGDVLHFRIDKEFLRLVAFRSTDSPYVVTEAYGESTPEGRMQLNPYVRGTWDRPRLIVHQGRTAEDGQVFTEFRYYSLMSPCASLEAPGRIETFQYLPIYRYGQTDSYSVAENVVEAVIENLTARMMAIYGKRSS